ncbi:MAG: hypothetical protein IANPNBLG_03226 [Bryobacteraceae bacterium]|nr:hypothetical protein [Bryobacteraceae bacterium]
METEEPRREQEEETGHVSADAMLYCPVCNQRLSEHKCKLVCVRCGYYMSCADYC